MYKRKFSGRSRGARSGGGRSFGGRKSFGHRNGLNRQKARGMRGSFNPQNFVLEEKVEKPVEADTITHKFTDFDLGATLQENIAKKGYITPSPIQDQTIPHILAGRDVIGIANTGTGKTAAFLLPLIHKVAQNRDKKVLIVTPTRELADQIKEEFISFSRGLNLYAVLTIGGASRFGQKKDLKRGYNFIIGTPGRIKDFVQTREIDLSKFDSVVLDEADHMLDMGFIKDVKFLISRLPQKRQSLFFSATVGSREQEVMTQLLTDPITVSVKQRETISNIKQNVVYIERGSAKIEKLSELLSQKEVEKAIIFGRTKHGVQKISNLLVEKGFRAGAIHGNKSQGQRARTLSQFKNLTINVLLATDVASRGLDIDDITHVINFDLPATREDYIHRIGRTGRAQKSGTAITFVER